MRLDKYLKVSRIIKRRPVANEACDKGHVSVNGKLAKAACEIKIGDVISIRFGERLTQARVLSINEHAQKAEAAQMYELISGGEIE